MMNIQTVIANLLNTIEGKELLLERNRKDLMCSSWTQGNALRLQNQMLEINLKELNAILTDCMAVREADIVRDLEIKELKRQNSEYGWMVSPDRMGQ